MTWDKNPYGRREITLLPGFRGKVRALQPNEAVFFPVPDEWTAGLAKWQNRISGALRQTMMQDKYTARYATRQDKERGGVVVTRTR